MTDDLTALRALAEKATPGPWIYHETIHADNHVTAGGGILTGTHVCGPTYERENARFIAAANPAVVLAMLDRLERAEAAIERAKAEAEKVSREQLVMPPEALILADATLAALDTGKEAGD